MCARVQIHLADGARGYIATVNGQLAVHLGGTKEDRMLSPPAGGDPAPWKAVLKGEGFTLWLRGPALVALPEVREARFEMLSAAGAQL